MRVRQLVRDAARVQAGRPALWAGLRAQLAVAAPMLVAPWVAAPVVTWATLGGFSGVLVDKGGAYPSRARAMIAAALWGGLLVLVGRLVAGSAAASAVVALGAAICALSAAWPGAAAAVGNTTAVKLIIAATMPHDPARPWLPALGYLAGAAWSLVLTLVLWPVRVYRPARLAAERCVHEIAQHAAELAARADAEPATWRDAVLRRHRAIRDSLEAARAVLAATRRGQRAELGRGERLLVIVAAMDAIFGMLIGCEEVIDDLAAEARAACARGLAAGLSAAGARLEQLAERLAVEHALPPLPPVSWDAGEVLGRAAALPALAQVEVEHAVSLIARIHHDVAAVAAVIDGLPGDREPAPPAQAHAGTASEVAPGAPPWSDAVREILAGDSVVLRHALRVGAVVLATLVIARALGLHRPYWAALTAFLLLQPYLPATITRGVQRVAGTIAGGMVAAAIVAVVRDPAGIALAAIVFAGVSAAVLQLNYGLYALFLTPTFILLADAHTSDVHLAWLRIANTLLGALLAVAGALLLWPSRESGRTADRAADAIAAAADYARQVFAAVAGHAPPGSRPVLEARRRAGRALNHADLSLERLAAEGPPARVLEPRMAVTTLTRRLVAALSAFATARHVADPGGAAAGLAGVAADAERFLHAAAAALRDGTAPPSYARHDALAAALPPLFAARLARIDLQLSILADAVARTVASAAPA